MSDVPAWGNEVFSWLAVAPQIVLTGNIADMHLSRFRDEPSPTLHTTVDVLTDRLRASGFGAVIHWNPVKGLHVARETHHGLVRSVLGEELWTAHDDPSASVLADLIVAVTEHPTLRAALVIEDAPRLAPSFTDPDLHRVYLVAQHQARRAPRHNLPDDTRQGLFNVVVWLVGSEAELPHWLVGANRVRLVSIPEPGRHERYELSASRLPHLEGFDRLGDGPRAELVARLTDFTEGLSLAEIATAIQVAVDKSIPADRVEEAVRFVRSANSTSPWSEPDLRERINVAAESLNRTVLGQQRAVRKVADVLARAALGLSGAYSSTHPTRPKGVLFLAGPTGVGKTAVAKRVTEILFGREEAMIRFDMSEFASEHSEARLLGAPPGYVGHHAGGELTNAVRRRPFCLLLFDEIEKAHPRILDTFLQILEDGRLTDSAGGTVHFTETVIVFTSNLGTSSAVTRARTTPAVRPGATYDEVELRVRTAIRREFLALGRPELLNRIGDNIIVFDFIGPEIAVEILRDSLIRVADRIRAQTGSVVMFASDVVGDLEKLVQQADRLAFGGRAVGAVVESQVLNPLARYLLTVRNPVRLTVERIWQNGDGTHIDVAEQPIA